MRNANSVVSGGVQSWSAGEIFPFRIVIVVNEKAGTCTVQAVNSEAGIAGCKWTCMLDAYGRLSDNFSAVHRCAEDEARILLRNPVGPTPYPGLNDYWRRLAVLKNERARQVQPVMTPFGV